MDSVALELVRVARLLLSGPPMYVHLVNDKKEKTVEVFLSPFDDPKLEKKKDIGFIYPFSRLNDAAKMGSGLSNKMNADYLIWEKRGNKYKFLKLIK